MDSLYPSQEIDFLGADRFSAFGDVPVLLVDAARWQRPRPDIQAVCIGIDRNAALPQINQDDFDLLLTSAPDAPRPWIGVRPEHMDAHIRHLADAVRTWPIAASILCRVLRLGEHLPFSSALDVESLAYSALLGGQEFAHWRTQTRPRPLASSAGPLVRVEREDDRVTVTLNHPEAQNAMTAAMRDALYEAIANVLDDPTRPDFCLKGAGKCFSTGGALDEFGNATDVAQAHVIRTLHNCARLLDQLGTRACVEWHRACVGSGLEVGAAAACRTATADAWFQLPELRMGLIPGAGGTASVARAIGRHRTAWMLLSGKRINAPLALDWGLISRIVT